MFEPRSLTNRHQWVVFLVAALVSPALLHGDDNKELQKKLEQELVGHVLVIRNFYTASKLTFDSNGSLVGNGGSPDWMRAQLEAADVKLEDDSLTVTGPRVKTAYHGHESGFVNVPQKDQVTVKLQLSSPSATEDQIKAALAKVFLTGAERLQDLVPPEWKARLHEACPFDEAAISSVPRVGVGVTPPKPTYSPDPSYPEDARSNRIQGRVKVTGILDVDGKMKCLAVPEHAGYGLDEQAVLAVRRWRFIPASVNGKPTPAKMTILVNFKLY